MEWGWTKTKILVYGRLYKWTIAALIDGIMRPRHKVSIEQIKSVQGRYESLQSKMPAQNGNAN